MYNSKCTGVAGTGLMRGHVWRQGLDMDSEVYVDQEVWWDGVRAFSFLERAGGRWSVISWSSEWRFQFFDG